MAEMIKKRTGNNKAEWSEDALRTQEIVGRVDDPDCETPIVELDETKDEEKLPELLETLKVGGAAEEKEESAAEEEEEEAEEETEGEGEGAGSPVSSSRVGEQSPHRRRRRKRQRHHGWW